MVVLTGLAINPEVGTLGNSLVTFSNFHCPAVWITLVFSLVLPLVLGLDA